MKKLLFILSIIVVPALFFYSHAGAVSDISYTVDSSNLSTYHLLCNTSTPCSDYSYLKVSFISSSIDLTTGNLPYLRTSYFYNNSFGSKNLDLYFSSTSQTYYVPISSAMYQIDYRSGTFVNSNLVSNWSLVLTLTNELGEPCPVPLPCPDCSEPAIVQLFKSGFWGVATALVSVIVPILALFLVFRLVHDLFWGKG